MKNEKIRLTDLTYLIEITRSNSIALFKMITLFLRDTPPMIQALKSSFKKRDWNSVHNETHSLMPTFRIMGMNKNFEKMASEIQEFNGEKEKFEEIEGLVEKLEADCNMAYKELKEELKKLKFSRLSSAHSK